MNENDLKNIIESLLFVTDAPIDVKTFKAAIPGAEAGAIRQALTLLMQDYEERQGGIKLSEVAGGYQFRTRSDYKEWVKRFLKPAPTRLSKAALETLAIIAYHQPVIRSDVEAIRGVDSGAILRNLLERKLVRILGKKEIPGRPLIYGTTKKFLEVFNLRSLKDMPTLQEIQDFADANAPGLGEDLDGETTSDQPSMTADSEAAEEAAQEADGAIPDASQKTPQQADAPADDPVTDSEDDADTSSGNTGEDDPEKEVT
ncbi:MAG: SMC-Scp complex subunit ScpB [Thermodesulfobacteriota bacterium]|nr:SMC-Scp complex subunit ScpB [Thermodesulfobacteriota bacterium]